VKRNVNAQTSTISHGDNFPMEEHKSTPPSRPTQISAGHAKSFASGQDHGSVNIAMGQDDDDNEDPAFGSSSGSYQSASSNDQVSS